MKNENVENTENFFGKIKKKTFCIFIFVNFRQNQQAVYTWCSSKKDYRKNDARIFFLLDR